MHTSCREVDKSINTVSQKISSIAPLLGGWVIVRIVSARVVPGRATSSIEVKKLTVPFLGQEGANCILNLNPLPLFRAINPCDHWTET